MDNLIQTIENKRVAKTFGNGLSSFTQTNCQVTLTDNGYRIYRPANIAASTKQWGGLRLQPYSMETRDVLQKGHTYIIKFHVKGFSSTANAITDTSCCFWSNNMGWTTASSGLNPSPSNVSYQYLPANFNGEMDCFYKWTINDEVWKTCTTSYSSFVAGTSYLSYRDFGFAWNYTATGTLGTDVYVTNIRMYDLTNGGQSVSVKKTGLTYCDMNESADYTKASMYKDNDMTTKTFIEY